MSIAAISSSHSVPISPEKTEGAGPDHDQDADNSVQTQQQAAPPPGTGTMVNKTA